MLDYKSSITKSSSECVRIAVHNYHA